jgi:hypothetical protein
MSGIIAQNSGRHAGLIKAASAAGVWNLIKTYTASSDSTLSFVEGTDGVDFTAYDEFVFKFYNIHPATDSAFFQFNMSIDTGSNYNVAKTSSSFKVYHAEDDAGSALTYETSSDLAQGTGVQVLSSNIDNDNDACFDGQMFLFAPSSTTFVKHFMSRGAALGATKYSYTDFIAGYGNTTSAVDAIQFSMSSGNIDAGQISLFGIS